MFASIKVTVKTVIAKVVSYGARFGRFAKSNTTVARTFATAHKATAGKFLLTATKGIGREFVWFLFIDAMIYTARAVYRKTLVRDVKVWSKLPLRAKFDLLVDFVASEIKSLVYCLAVVFSAVSAATAVVLHFTVGVVIGFPVYLVTRLVSKDKTTATAHRAYERVVRPAAWLYGKSVSALLVAWMAEVNLEEGRQRRTNVRAANAAYEGLHVADGTEETVFTNADDDFTVRVNLVIDGDEAAADPFNYGAKLAQGLDAEHAGTAYTLKARVKRDLKRVGLDAKDFVQVVRGYESLATI